MVDSTAERATIQGPDTQLRRPLCTSFSFSICHGRSGHLVPFSCFSPRRDHHAITPLDGRGFSQSTYLPLLPLANHQQVTSVSALQRPGIDERCVLKCFPNSTHRSPASVGSAVLLLIRLLQYNRPVNFIALLSFSLGFRGRLWTLL